MLRSRLIPCLLIQDDGLVKTFEFKSPRYLGDPINAVKIFNEKEADELIVLDIDATAKQNEPNYKLIEKLARECRMPLCIGGGIKTLAQAKKIIDMGVEKIAISSAAIENPSIISEIAKSLGRQSVVAVVDIKKVSRFRSTKWMVYTHNGKTKTGYELFSTAEKLENAGAGEIVVNSIDRDGSMVGYDLDMVKKLREVVGIPISVLGGAGSETDVMELVNAVGVVGAAAGSLFVFKGKLKAVLINYPNKFVKEKITSVSAQL